MDIHVSLKYTRGFFLILISLIIGFSVALSPLYASALLILIFIFFISFIKRSWLINLITFTVPFMQAFNVNIGSQYIRLSDIFILILLVVILFSCFVQEDTNDSIVTDNYYRKLLICTILILGVAFLSDLWSSTTNQKALELGATILNLSLLNLDLGFVFKIIVSFAYLICGFYVVKNRIIYKKKFFRLFLFTVCLQSIYVIIEFIWINTGHPHWVLPGQHANWGTSYQGDRVLRPFGTFNEPGDLAVFLTFTLSVCLALFFSGTKSRFLKWTLFSNVVSLLLTFSTAGIIGCVFVTIISYVINKKNTRNTFYMIIFGLIVLSLILLFSNQLSEAIFEKFNNSISETDRLSNYVIGIDMFKDYYFLGVGFEHFGLIRNFYATNIGLPYKLFRDLPNSLYLEIFSEQGIIGLFVWLNALFVWFKIVLKKTGSLHSLLMINTLVALSIQFVSRSEFALSYLLWYLGLFIGSLYLVDNDKQIEVF